MSWQAVWAVFRFELARAMTPVRVMFWFALVAFPVGIAALIRIYQTNIQAGELEFTALRTFILVPEAVCALGMLLWATPVVQGELEGKTWCYLAVRSGGKSSVLLGKYFAAVAWTGAAAMLALGLSLAIAPPRTGGGQLWLAFPALVALSCPAYGALYILLGVVAIRRAMMIAVVYTAVVEVFLGWVPATINQLTIQYHLRCLMGKWVAMRVPSGGAKEFFFGTEPAVQHILILLGGTAALLVAAMIILNRRELVRADET